MMKTNIPDPIIPQIELFSTNLLSNNSFDQSLFKLGKLCKNGHDYQETGESLRYVKNRTCSECNKEHNKEYHQKNKDKNKEYMKEYNKKYYRENQDYFKKKDKKYKDKNKEYIKEYMKEYYRENQDKIKIQHKKYKQENQDKIKEYKKEYGQGNKDKCNEHSRQRRARKRNCHTVKFSPSELSDKLTYFNNSCCYCGIKFTEETIVTWDHFIPISKGGTHTLSNLLPCCFSCNCSKNAKYPDEFLKEIGLSKSKINRILKNIGKEMKDIFQLPLF